MAHIVPMLLDRINDHLTTTLQTLVPEDDPIRANEVKIGRFQDSPTDYTVWVAIINGDPDDPEKKDGITSLGGNDDIAFNPYAREIGGGESWYRHGVAQFGCYFIGKSEIEARELSFEVAGRICKYLATVPVTDLTDNFGEQAIKLFAYGQTIFEGGGPGSYIWRGKVWWRCLTERS